MSGSTLIELVGLVVLLLIGIAVVLHIASARRRLISFSVLAIATYLVVYPLSGIAHLALNNSSSRGYFDLLVNSHGGGLDRLLICGLGFAALLLPILLNRDPRRSSPTLRFTPGMGRATFAIGIVVLPVAALAVVQMVDYAQTVDATRIAALSGGMARVGFASQWITWAVSFIALGFLVRNGGVRGTIPVIVVVVLSIAVIASSLAWTGGRAIVLMMAAPLVLALWPGIRKGARATMIVVASVAFAVFLAVTTVARSASYSGAGFSLARVLDWEVGRYSMLGYSVDRVDAVGILWGETLAEGALQVPRGLFQFAGLTLPPGFRSVTQITGADLLGDPRLNYIVPGMTAETYLNFGVLGVVTAYFVLGWLITKVDRLLETSGDPALRLASAYLGVLLVFCTFSSQSGAGFNYLLFTGFPVVLLLVVYQLRARRQKKTIRSDSGAAGVRRVWPG